MLNKAVAETIKELRKQKGISQERLAEAIDSHQVYISEIERGRKMPSLPVLYEISKCFGLSLSELMEQIEKKLS